MEKIDTIPIISISGFHPISWFHHLGYLGSLTREQAEQQRLEYICEYFSLEQRFNVALEEGNFEVILLIEAEHQIDYDYVLENATTPIIAQWAFTRAKEQGMTISPQIRPSLSIDDPYYKNVKIIFNKNGIMF